MRLNRKEFSEVLKIAASLSGKKITLPILGSAMIDIEKRALYATDLETSISCDLVPMIKEISDQDKSFCINAGLLHEIVTALPKEIKEVTIERKSENKVYIHGASVFVMSTLEFPVIPTHTPVATIRNPGMLGMLKNIFPCAGKSDARYVLNGVYVDPQKGHIVATDGLRLAFYRFTTESLGGGPEPVPFVIPRPTAMLMMGIDYDPDSISYSVLKPGKAPYMSIAYPIGMRVSFRPLEGQYPNYEPIIPTDIQYRFTINRQALLEKMTQGMPIASDTMDAHFDLGETNTISITNHQVGMFNSDSLPGQLEGGSIAFNLNLGYLLDAIRPIQSDQVILNINGKHDPICIKDEAYTALVMPKGER